MLYNFDVSEYESCASSMRFLTAKDDIKIKRHKTWFKLRKWTIPQNNHCTQLTLRCTKLLKRDKKELAHFKKYKSV